MSVPPTFTDMIKHFIFHIRWISILRFLYFIIIIKYQGSWLGRGNGHKENEKYIQNSEWKTSSEDAIWKTWIYKSGQY
jgi:hypothetical protein